MFPWSEMLPHVVDAAGTSAGTSRTVPGEKITAGKWWNFAREVLYPAQETRATRPAAVA